MMGMYSHVRGIFCLESIAKPTDLKKHKDAIDRAIVKYCKDNHPLDPREFGKSFYVFADANNAVWLAVGSETKFGGQDEVEFMGLLRETVLFEGRLDIQYEDHDFVQEFIFSADGQVTANKLKLPLRGYAFKMPH